MLVTEWFVVMVSEALAFSTDSARYAVDQIIGVCFYVELALECTQSTLS